MFTFFSEWGSISETGLDFFVLWFVCNIWQTARIIQLYKCFQFKGHFQWTTTGVDWEQSAYFATPPKKKQTNTQNKKK